MIDCDLLVINVNMIYHLVFQQVVFEHGPFSSLIYLLQMVISIDMLVCQRVVVPFMVTCLRYFMVLSSIVHCHLRKCHFSLRVHAWIARESEILQHHVGFQVVHTSTAQGAKKGALAETETHPC